MPASRANLSGLFEQTPIDFARAHHLRGDDKIAHLALHGQVIHQLQHEVFENHAQAARADFALKSQLRDSFESVVSEAQFHVFKLKETLVLLEQSVFRLGENLHQSALVEVVHDTGYGQAANKFRNQAVADQVAGLNLFEQFRVAALWCGDGFSVGVEAEGAASGALFDNFFEAHEGAAADEQNIGGIDRGKFLVRVLAATLRRHVGNGPFQNFQQGLLHTFAADIAGDGGIFVLLGNLIDFVDVDDAGLGFLYVAIGGLQ